MSRLILIENAWRFEENELLAVPDDGVETRVVGLLNPCWWSTVNGFERRSPKYRSMNAHSARLFQQRFKQQFGLHCPLFCKKAIECVSLLKTLFPITMIRMAAPVADEEKKQLDQLVEHLPECRFELVWVNSLYDQHQFSFSNDVFLKSFSGFRRRVEQAKIPVVSVRNSLNKINLKALDHSFDEVQANDPVFASSSLFDPGEKAALERLEQYTFVSNQINNYKETRNNLLGDFSSKFSVGLAHGTISPKTIWNRVEQYERVVCENESTYWLKFELLWREFFRHAFYFNPRSYFLKGGIHSRFIPSDGSHAQFLNWVHARTSSDFINANMVELRKTGYMSNRGRQNVASYLIHDLQCDWRWGASYFESTLLDYDVSSNWGNWAYIAGVGNDTRVRRFNIDVQQQRYDPQKQYIQFWLSDRSHTG